MCRRNHDCVHRYADAAQVPVDVSHNGPRIAVVRYDEQVNVAAAIQVAPRGGPEENYLLRMGDLYNAPEEMMPYRTALQGLAASLIFDV